jgi:hypothetical protein
MNISRAGFKKNFQNRTEWGEEDVQALHSAVDFKKITEIGTSGIFFRMAGGEKSDLKPKT